MLNKRNGKEKLLQMLQMLSRCFFPNKMFINFFNNFSSDYNRIDDIDNI